MCPGDGNSDIDSSDAGSTDFQHRQMKLVKIHNRTATGVLRAVWTPAVLRRGKQMEKLPHCKFSCIVSSQQQWQMLYLYGAETWALRKVDQKYLEGFDIWCWRRMGKISWIGHDKYEVLHKVREERNVLYAIKEWRLTWLVKSCVGIAF